MTPKIVSSARGVTLVGGGPVQGRMLAMALRRAPVLVAADGGADRVLAAGHMPVAVIGDFDSLSVEGRRLIPADRQHMIAEQDSTDFDKALRSIAAPFVLALGFAGARIDHGLAVFNTLLRYPDRVCIVLGAEDAVVSDALNHASIIDGIRLCKAKRYRYANSDMADLEAQLKAAKADKARFILIATDGVFSMDGFYANLPEIRTLAEAVQATVTRALPQKPSKTMTEKRLFC